MDYPRYHRDIVNDLLDGKFVLATDAKFVELKTNGDFYGKFFKESFDFYLVMKAEYAFLISEETMESLSRDICIFLGVLCYELDKEGKNFLDEIQYAEFDQEIIDTLFENSSYIDLIQNNNQLKNSDNRKQFLGTLNRRNIIDRSSDRKFTFTPAYREFMEFARNFAKGKLQQNTVEEESQGA